MGRVGSWLGGLDSKFERRLNAPRTGGEVHHGEAQVLAVYTVGHTDHVELEDNSIANKETTWVAALTSVTTQDASGGNVEGT